MQLEEVNHVGVTVVLDAQPMLLTEAKRRVARDGEAAAHDEALALGVADLGEPLLELVRVGGAGVDDLDVLDGDDRELRGVGLELWVAWSRSPDAACGGEPEGGAGASAVAVAAVELEDHVPDGRVGLGDGLASSSTDSSS